MDAEGADEVDLVRLASNKSRSMIIRQLISGPANLGSIARKTGMSRQLATHHVSVLVSSGIAEQRAVGSVRLYTLSERGLQVAQKVLGSSPKSPADRMMTEPRLADLGPVAVALAVMLVAIVKFLTTPEAPWGWLVGGAAVSGSLFVILRKILRPSVQE